MGGLVRNGGAARLATGFAGTSAVRNETAGLLLTETEYAGGLVQRRHGHVPAYFSSVESGAYDETWGGRTEEIVAPHLVFHPAGEEHGVRFRAGTTRILRIETRPALLGRSATSGSGSRCGRAGWRATRRGSSRGSGASSARPDGFSDLVLEGLALELLAETARALAGGSEERSGRTSRVARGYDALRAGFRARLSLAAAAEAAGMHPVAFARAFRRRYGCSSGEFVRRLRVEDAARRLRTGDEPVAAIAARDRVRGPGAPRAASSARGPALTPVAYRAAHRGGSGRSRDRRVQAGRVRSSRFDGMRRTLRRRRLPWRRRISAAGVSSPRLRRASRSAAARRVRVGGPDLARAEGGRRGGPPDGRLG